MLSEQTIKEGTILMCSLMAFPVMPNGNYKLPNRFPAEKDYTKGWIEIDVTGMAFHLDWNWIHAVIDEIHESYAEVHLQPCHSRIIDNGYNQALWYKDSGFTPLESTFYLLTQYLEWSEEKEVPQPKTEIYISDDLPF